MSLPCEWYIGRGVISGALGIFYIFVLYAILQSKSKKFSSPYYKLVVSLAAADLISILYNVARASFTCSNPGLKYYAYIASEASETVELLHMVAIGVNRLVATMYTVEMDIVFSPLRVNILLIGMWFSGFVWGFYYSGVYIFWPLAIGEKIAFDIEIFTYGDVALSLICVFLTILLCLATGVRLRQSLREKSKNRATRTREIKLYLQMCLMCFFLLYNNAAWTISNYDLQKPWGLIRLIFVDGGLSFFYVLFIAFNPVLYVIFDKEIRGAVVSLLRKWGLKGQNSVADVGIRTTQFPTITTF